MSNHIQPLNVGKPDIKPSKPSHVPGVRQGNRSPAKGIHGLKRYHGKLLANAARSTGIRPTEREPIDPRMPHLSPA